MENGNSVKANRAVGLEKGMDKAHIMSHSQNVGKEM
jgi:hypothetical protein